MTQQQILQEFGKLPRNIKSVVLRKLLKAFEDDLENETVDLLVEEKRELTKDERRRIAKSLGGSIKMENPPMTKEEVREQYYGHLAEKYK